MSYLVHLQKFEGPMGLLLYLIRKEEMDVFDINVSELTRQYLEHIRMMRELDLEVAGEFVAMAATLLQIKSRMLLPQYGEDGEPVDVPDDPRRELVQKILEYQRFQDAGKKLYERPVLSRDVWLRGSREQYLGGEDGEGEIILDSEGLFGLIATYRKAVRKMKSSVHAVREKGVSIAGRILEIKDRLLVGLRVNMRELLRLQPEAGNSFRNELLITFLSMLELGRMGFVSLFQNENYGDIMVLTLRPIERNVLERVQEFDSSASAEFLKTAFAEPAKSPKERAAELAAELDQEPVEDAPQTSFVLSEASSEGFDAGDTDRLDGVGETEETATDLEIELAEAEIIASRPDAQESDADA